MTEKLRYLASKFGEAVTILRREHNRKALFHIIREGKKLLLRLSPKKGSGWVKFGTGDPYDTGRAMEIVALMYPFYWEHVKVIPIFERAELSGEGDISGRTNLAGILFPLAALMLDRDVRAFIKELNEYKEKL